MHVSKPIMLSARYQVIAAECANCAEKNNYPVFSSRAVNEFRVRATTLPQTRDAV